MESKAIMASNVEAENQLQEITDLLVAAGYFRARIKTLAAFDKVVGGMVWCIENCNFDVDVDLLFQENSTIGQKIALTEKIVAVLKQMKCPHMIEPHQIQGLDFKNIFSAIQWLVKKSLETRHERGERIRSLAISKFHRMFYQTDSGLFEARPNYVVDLVNSYGAVRKFRRQGQHPEDEAASVESTLFEYSGKSLRANTEQEQSELEKVQELMGEMIIADDEESNTLRALAVENFLRNVEQKQDKTESTTDTLKGKKLILERQQETLLTALSKAVSEKKDVEQNVNVANEKVSSLQLVLQKLDEESEEFACLHSEENKDLVRELLDKVTKLENLKQEEAAFKQQCHEELEQLQKNIKELQADDQEIKEPIVSEKLEEQKKTLANLRIRVAKVNRSIASMQRQIDEVPGRAELAQYQKRFLELYTQVADKHKETKQYFTLYNTMHDTHSYLKKELDLLNSIQESYAQAMSSSSCKEQFALQFKEIVERVQKNKVKIEAKYNEERVKRDQLSHTLQNLVEQERKYINAVKQLTIECKNNEDLLACIRSKGGQ